jgi:poly-gamma-glutamate synthesis protein (capsule biosynthesis protein)
MTESRQKTNRRKRTSPGIPAKPFVSDEVVARFDDSRNGVMTSGSIRNASIICAVPGPRKSFHDLLKHTSFALVVESDGAVSNFPLPYRLSWLPRFLRPSLAGDTTGFAAPAARLLSQPPTKTVRLVFLGDISAVANRRTPEIDAGLASIIASADLVIGNCESPIVRKGRTLRTRLGVHHAMDTGFLLGLLAAMDIDSDRLVLSLANNHVLDQGIGGYAETRDSLGSLGIRTIGTTDHAPVTTLAVEGVAVGLVAFTDWRNGAARDFARRILMTGQLAKENWHSVCAAHADLICAVPHWDWEFRHFPRDGTRALAHRLAAQGIGLIAGHHAHVVQPVERIGDAVVAYGLGDFLGTAFFRQPWPGRIGAMLVADVSADKLTKGRIAAYEMVPFVRLRDGGREKLVGIGRLNGALREKVSERLSRVLGTKLARPA